jgi:hypothetical protein
LDRPSTFAISFKVKLFPTVFTPLTAQKKSSLCSERVSALLLKRVQEFLPFTGVSQILSKY